MNTAHRPEIASTPGEPDPYQTFQITIDIVNVPHLKSLYKNASFVDILKVCLGSDPRVPTVETPNIKHSVPKSS